MDWDAAIDRNRTALARIVATLAAMAGLADGDVLARPLHRLLLRLLRPAEAAARRLIVLAARNLVLAPSAQRRRRPKRASAIVLPRGLPHAATAAPSRLALPLFDPLRAAGRRRPASRLATPRIVVAGHAPASSPSHGRPAHGGRIRLRLDALARALDDLPAQARRLALWRRRRDLAAGRRRPVRQSPLRPGRPPGWRRKPVHEVDELLAVVHGLATWWLSGPPGVASG